MGSEFCACLVKQKLDGSTQVPNTPPSLLGHFNLSPCNNYVLTNAARPDVFADTFTAAIYTKWITSGSEEEHGGGIVDFARRCSYMYILIQMTDFQYFQLSLFLCANI